MAVSFALVVSSNLLGRAVGHPADPPAAADNLPSPPPPHALVCLTTYQAVSTLLLPKPFLLCRRSLPTPSDRLWGTKSLQTRLLPNGLPGSYPDARPANLDSPLLFEKLETEALFYAFYYQPGTYQQYLAARELKRQSWRYHKQHRAWFQVILRTSFPLLFSSKGSCGSDYWPPASSIRPSWQLT